MSASTPSPPRNRDRRVSFNLGNEEKAPSFFNKLAAASYSTMPSNFGNGGGNGRGARTTQHRRPDRRARVEDVDDSDSDRGRGGPKSGRDDRAAAVAGPPDGLPAVQPGQPSITASAAAAGYNGLDPAVSANHVYTHVENGVPGYSGVQMPGFHGMVQNAQNIQAFPTFMPAGMPAGIQPGLAYGPGGLDSSGMTGISFLPAVPDATNGPMLHTYIPRGDAPGQAMYMPGYNVSPYAQLPQQYAQSAPYYYASRTMPGIAATTSPMIPVATQGGVAYVQQPQMAYVGGQPVMAGGPVMGPMMNGPMMANGPPMMAAPGIPGMPGMPGNYYGGVPGMPGVHPEPALGVGQTPSEVLQEQLEFAYNNNMHEPQDFKPADDDKSRFYWVRELDGNWTQRSRATVDHIGCRWYITDSGVFYAVRLPN